MKKSKRTWLLLSGVAALSATLLVPTVLSACSTAPEENKPGDGDTNKPGGDEGNKPGGDGNTDQDTKPNKLADELKKLNDSANASARKNIYTDYFKAINKTVSVRLSELTPPNLIKPTVTPLIEITKKGDFFGDLITMINKGLDVGTTSTEGQISSEELSKLISHLNSEKSIMINQGSFTRNGKSSTGLTSGSIWSPNAFEFSDVSTATWTFISQDKNTVYELFLTENVDYKFESTVDKVSVKVSNKVGSDKTRSRLVVTTKKSGTAGAKTTSGETTTPSATYESKTYNFKSNVDFALPSSLFDDFTSYLEAFDANVKELKEYLPNATKKYKDLTSDSTKGFASAATLWNQFVSQNEESLLETMTSDLNTNRSKSKIFEWIKANVSETASANGTTDTTLAGELEKDLEAAKNVNLDLDTLLIKGQNADNNGINNIDSEEPDYTLIISFDVEEILSPEQKSAASAEVPLDEKWYVLNLKATGFEFENTFNQEFFGYQNTSFATKPKLKLDAKSDFASYKFTKTGSQVGGRDEVTVEKIKNTSLNKKDQFVDISNIYDINGTGFTKFLSDLVINRESESTKLTDKLLNLNSNNSKKAITAFKEYLNQDQEAVKEKLLEPNVLADFILDNIDITNQAMYSNGSYDANQSTGSNPEVPGKGSSPDQSWRTKINNFVGINQTEKSKKPIITFKANESTTPSTSTSIEQQLTESADIVLKVNQGLAMFWGPTNAFTHVYIFLGSSDSNEESIVSTDSANNTNINVYQSSSSTRELSTNQSTGPTDVQTILQNVKNRFSIVFQERNGKQGIHHRVHAFYMGQEKQQIQTVEGAQTTPTYRQVNFPVSLNALLANDSKFLNLLFKADDSSGGESQPEVISNRILRKK